MNLQISSDNIEISESMKVLAKQKVKKLERYWSDIPDESKSLRVVLNSAPNDSFLVKLEANLNGMSLYTEEPGFEFETAIVDAVEELARKYRKMKERIMSGDWEQRSKKKGVTEDLLRADS